MSSKLDRQHYVKSQVQNVKGGIRVGWGEEREICQSK